MNKPYFFRDAKLSKRLRGAAWFFGLSAGVVAMFCLVSGPAITSGTALTRGDDDDKAGACTRTARVAFTACQHEAEDNYWIAIGKCHNLSDPDARAECKQEARVERRSKLNECGVHRQGRLRLCEALGEAPYDPQIDPAMFVDPNQIGMTVAPNPYFLLLPGRTMVYREGAEEIRVTVTRDTRVIAGVTTRVVHDVVKNNGEVIEDTTDWYAQDIYGNVWYFGEIAQKIEDGILVSIDGSWTTGVNRDKPGFAMKRFPVVGETYRQEFSLNNAEDAAKVLTLTGSATVPAASCNGNCLITREFSPIIPSLLEDKYFAPGVGFILETKPGTTDRLELVEIIQN